MVVRFIYTNTDRHPDLETETERNGTSERACSRSCCRLGSTANLTVKPGRIRDETCSISSREKMARARTRTSTNTYAVSSVRERERETCEVGSAHAVLNILSLPLSLSLRRVCPVSLCL